jgi:hypothetical protein
MRLDAVRLEDDIRNHEMRKLERTTLVKGI